MGLADKFSRSFLRSVLHFLLQFLERSSYFLDGKLSPQSRQLIRIERGILGCREIAPGGWPNG